MIVFSNCYISILIGIVQGCNSSFHACSCMFSALERMSQTEYEAYRNQLLTQLKDVPEETWTKLLESFENQYARGLLAGKSPEQILKELRTPQEVAQDAEKLPSTPKRKEADRLFIARSQEFTNNRVDFQMVAAILIPLLFLLGILLHCFEIYKKDYNENM